MKISQYLFTSTAWVISLRVGNAVLAIVVSAILARLLDPEKLGFYFLIFSVVMISSNLVRAGQGAAAIRLIAEAEALEKLGRARQVALLTLYGTTAIALLFALMYYGFFGPWLFAEFFGSPAVLGLIGLMAVWIVIVGVRSQIAFIFRGMHAVRLAALFNGFVSTLATLALLIYLYNRQGTTQLSDVLAFSIAGASFGLLVALVFLRSALKNFKGEGSVRVAEISTIAWPLFLIAITNMVMTQGDMVLVGNLFDEKALAFYGVSLRLKRIVVLEMLVLGTVVSPVIARLYAQKDNLRLERMMRLVSTLALIPLSLVTLILLVFGDTIIAWIFGEVYREAYPILAILLAGLYLSALMGSGQQLMVMTGHERELLPIKVIGGLSAIAVGILTAPYLGVIGVALGFSLATAGISIVTALRAKKLTGITCYVHSPAYFLDHQNRREITTELGRLIRQSLSGKRGRGRSTAHEE